MDRVRITDTLLSGRTEYVFNDPAVPPGRVEYWLEELSRSGDTEWHGPAVLDPGTSFPETVTIGLAIPNPFQKQMSVTYTLPDIRPVRVSIYDLAGRRVRVLVDETQGPGEHVARWRGRTDAGTVVVPGLYFIRFEAGTEALSRKVLFIR